MIQSGCLSGTFSTWKASLKGSNPAAPIQEKFSWVSEGILEEQQKHGFSEPKKEAFSRKSHLRGETGSCLNAIP